MKNNSVVQALFLLVCCAPFACPQGYLITTAAGDFPLPLTVATRTVADNPKAVAVDPSGTAYFIANNVVSRLNADETLTRIAGRIPAYGAYSGDGGNAIEAGLNQPAGLAVDAAGNVYIADTGNNVIRKVTLDGLIQTVAGNGTAGYTGDAGAATSAELNQPSGIAVDAAGNLYIADTRNQRLRKVATDGTISTIAGNGSAGFSGDEGAASTATLNSPVAVAVDVLGNIYLADLNNNRVRKISRAGVIATVVGPGPTPALNPTGIAVDSAGNIFVANGVSNDVIEVNASNSATLVAGNGTSGFSGDNGPATSAQLSSPKGLAVDSSGNLYIVDAGSGRIRKVSGGNITTVTGTGTTSATGGATPANNSLNYGLALDASKNIFTADYGNSVVHRVDANGDAIAVTGTGTAGYSGDGGQSVNAQLNHPTGLVIDTTGNLYISDAGNHRIRKVASNGIITTFAGTGTAGYSGDGGQSVNAQINVPAGLKVASNGDFYFADNAAHVIRKISGGVISTIAGTGTAGFSGDGGPATSATLDQPSDLAIDSSGNVLIADAGNGRVRKIANGTISTLATVSSLSGIIVDSTGNAYVTSPAGNVIERITTGGTVTTIAGLPGTIGFSGDGGQAAFAQLNFPTAITIDATGDIFFSDTHNFAIRELIPVGVSPVLFAVKSHTGSFTLAQNGAAYAVTVNNATGAAATTGTVTVIENAPPGLNLVSLSGSGWSCSSNTCTRSDSLSAGSAFPALTVLVNVNANAPAQVANYVTLTGGGATATSDNDFTNILPNSTPGAPVLVAPSSGAVNVSFAPTLSWNASSGATSYDVYFGTTATPPFVLNTNQTSYSPGPLAVGTTYYWKVVARNASVTASSAVWSFTTFGSCGFALNPTAASALPTAGAEAFNVFTGGGCAWTAVSNVPWLTIAAGASGSGPGEVDYVITANPYASARTGTITAGGQTFTVTEAGNTNGLQFIPVTPCRIADTRTATGSFGGPILSAGSTREFDVPASACNIPGSAVAYSVNATVVPSQALNFLTLWTTGQPQPRVSTLNSDGRVKANAAVVVAGTNGGINVYVTDQTQFILDIDGYFVPKGTANSLAFHALTPCRIADTRKAAGPLGGPALLAGTSRSFPVLSSSCAVPSTAQAYSLNITALPHSTLNYLTTWPTGQAQPRASTLNASTGAVTANAAIVPAGTSGNISLFVSDAADVLIDVNGYFDSTQSGGLSLYPVAPCRAADSRMPAGSPPFSGTVPLNVSGSACNAPVAQAYLANATVVPTGSLAFLTLSADGQPRPAASTLNAYDGAVTSNLAIVPSTNGVVDAFASNLTYAIFDLLGFFNP